MRTYLETYVTRTGSGRKPLLKKHYHEIPLEIVYEDNYLVVVNKPAGMLSVPGKGEIDSVYQHIKTLYPDATGPLIVHRLDMATSGVLLIAKTKKYISICKHNSRIE